MTIVTNKHNYYFHVTSNSALTRDKSQQTYTLKFNYPDEARARTQAENKARAQAAAINNPKPPVIRNADYRFSGNKQIMPLHVFDDGRFTYFELRKNQPAPAIFAVDNKQGKESMVNTRRQGNYLVVQRIAPQFTLRNGGIVASVFNSQEIINIKQQG
jgi:type IV secretion system protein VirB9